MNSVHLPANIVENVQHIHPQNSLYKLQLSLTEYFCAFLPIYYHGLESSLQDSSFIQIERLQCLDWESPGDPGLQSASFILKKMEEAMVACIIHIRRLPNIRQGHLSRYHDQERGETDVCNRGLKEDCEVVTQILQQQTGLLKTNRQIESLVGLNPSLRRILTYLRNNTIRPSSSCPTSYEADKALEDLDWILR
ncbi:hypothetical protein ABFA07_002024 [Porites harrisoni]